MSTQGDGPFPLSTPSYTNHPLGHQGIQFKQTISGVGFRLLIASYLHHKAAYLPPLAIPFGSCNPTLGSMMTLLSSKSPLANELYSSCILSVVVFYQKTEPQSVMTHKLGARIRIDIPDEFDPDVKFHGEHAIVLDNDPGRRVGMTSATSHGTILQSRTRNSRTLNRDTLVGPPSTS